MHKVGASASARWCSTQKKKAKKYASLTRTMIPVVGALTRVNGTEMPAGIPSESTSSCKWISPNIECARGMGGAIKS